MLPKRFHFVNNTFLILLQNKIEYLITHKQNFPVKYTYLCCTGMCQSILFMNLSGMLVCKGDVDRLVFQHQRAPDFLLQQNNQALSVKEFHIWGGIWNVIFLVFRKFLKSELCEREFTNHTKVFCCCYQLRLSAFTKLLFRGIIGVCLLEGIKRLPWDNAPDKLF